jgi:nucleoside-diphosphate-sugar epimerase
MTLLVTGATGRLGSRFVPRLLQDDSPVRVLVRDPRRAQPLRELGAEVFVGDLRDADAVRRALDGVAAVVHLGAAFRGVSEAEGAAVTESATVALGRAAAGAGVRRFVFSSTNLVYGQGRGRPAVEDDEPAPAMAYPSNKVHAERALGAIDGLGLRVLRFAFVYGEGDPHLRESLMWARDWALHRRLHVLHHADVGQALLLALRADGIDGRTFNVADDAPVTAFELLRLNREPVATDATSRALEDAWEGIVDSSRIRRELGFRPLYPTVYTAQAAGAL